MLSFPKYIDTPLKSRHDKLVGWNDVHSTNLNEEAAMRIVEIRLRSASTCRRLIFSLVFFAASQAGSRVHGQPVVIVPPNPPSNVYSDYSVGTTELKITYDTLRGADGVTTLVNGAPSPLGQKMSINWRTSSGVPPTEGVLVSFKATIRGVSKTFTTTNAVMRDKTAYPLDSTELARNLIVWINNRLPRDFDPNTVLMLDVPIEVTVIPIILPIGTLPPVIAPAAGYSLGTPTRTSVDLPVTLIAG